MSQNIDLKQIERKAYTSYFQDGLWDIFMGLLMLGMGITIAFESEILYGVVLAIAVLVVSVGRKLITEPRIGRAKFGMARKIKLGIIVVVLTISSLFGVGVFLAAYYGVDIPHYLMATIAGVWFFIVFSLMAFGGALFALDRDSRSELPAALVYAGSAVGAALAGDLLTLFVFWDIMALASAVVLWSAATPGSLP